MFLLRRISKVKWGKEWEAASYLYNMAKAHEEAGRSDVRVYMTGLGTPALERTIVVEWTTDKIEASARSKNPKEALDNYAKLAPLLDAYYVEFHELITPDKLKERGFPV